MFKHAIEDNKNDLDSAQFSRKIQLRFKNPIQSKVDEACLIQRKDLKNLLNSKTEYFGLIILRKIENNKKGKS